MDNDKLNVVRAKVMNMSSSSTPEFVQSIIDVVTDLLVELLNQRGLTLEEFRARRTQLVQDEQVFIDTELEKFVNNES